MRVVNEDKPSLIIGKGRYQGWVLLYLGINCKQILAASTITSRF